MVDLLFRKPDVYIRQLKFACATMRLTPKLPSGLLEEPPLDSGGADDGDSPNRQANSEIEHHIFAYTNACLWFHICCQN